MSLLTVRNRVSLALFAVIALSGNGYAAGEDEEIRTFVAFAAVAGLLAGAAALIPGYSGRHTPRELLIAGLLAAAGGVTAWRFWPGPYTGFGPMAGLLAAAALLRLVIALKDRAEPEDDQG